MASYSNGSDRRVKIISIIHIVISVLLVAVGIAQLVAINHWSSNQAVGLWTGLWSFVTGVLGCRSICGNRADNQNNSSTGYIATFMAFSIISSILAVAGMVVYCTAMEDFRRCSRYSRRYDYHNGHFYTFYRSRGMSGLVECRAALGLGCFTLVLLWAECLLSVFSSFLCCNAVCCTGPAKQKGPRVVFICAGGGMVQMEGGMVIGQSGQVPQPYLAQQVQATTALQPGYQAPPPAYSGPMASGVTPTQSAEKQPEKNLRVSVEK